MTIEVRPPTLVAASVLVAISSVAWAWAAQPPARQSASVNLIACAKKKGGALRVAPKSRRCRRGERKISWARQGPAGAPGLAGAKGAAGLNGTNASVNGVAAGGDLTGTYPAPQIGPGKVTNAELGTLNGLNLAESTDPTKGINFGSDTAFYRDATIPAGISTTDPLRASGGLTVDGGGFVVNNSGASKFLVSSTGQTTVNAADGNGFLAMREQSSPPTAPTANNGRLYLEDNGSGKTRLMILFSSGAAQQIAIQP